MVSVYNMRSTKTCDLRVIKTVLSGAPKVQSQILLAESFHLLINAVHSQNDVDRILKQRKKCEPHTRPKPIEFYEKSTNFFRRFFRKIVVLRKIGPQACLICVHSIQINTVLCYAHSATNVVQLAE